MTAKSLFARETPSSGLVDDFALLCRRLSRYSAGLTEEELRWTPGGINNSISWILCHLATTLWICHSLVLGTRCQYDPIAAGLAMASVKGIDYAVDGRLPPIKADDPDALVRKGFEALREAFGGGTENLEDRSIYADRSWRTGWWFLTHELGDFAYHTGQASYLRKLIAYRRMQLTRRKGGSSPRAR